jgi:hypothetical protein
MNPPLTTKDYTAINRTLADCNQVRGEIEKAKLAGIPVDEAEMMLEHCEAQLKKLKEVYFPHKP